MANPEVEAAVATREEIGALIEKADIPDGFRRVVSHLIESQIERDATGNVLMGGVPLAEGFREWLRTPDGQAFRNAPGTPVRKHVSQAAILGNALASAFIRGG